MPLVYTLALATAGNTTCNATPNTENNTGYATPGAARLLSLLAFYACGKGAGLTAISGIIHRIVRFTTASTSGTAITPGPRDFGAQAAKATAASGGTTGSVRVLGPIIGCGAAGPGAWVAANADAMINVESGSGDSIDMLNACGTASLTFEWSAEIQE